MVGGVWGGGRQAGARTSNPTESRRRRWHTVSASVVVRTQAAKQAHGRARSKGSHTRWERARRWHPHHLGPGSWQSRSSPRRPSAGPGAPSRACPRDALGSGGEKKGQDSVWQAESGMAGAREVAGRGHSRQDRAADASHGIGPHFHGQKTPRAGAPPARMPRPAPPPAALVPFLPRAPPARVRGRPAAAAHLPIHLRRPPSRRAHAARPRPGSRGCSRGPHPRPRQPTAPGRLPGCLPRTYVV